MLRRMLLDFDLRNTSGDDKPKEATLQSMERVLRRFEEQARLPLQNLLKGELGAVMMIQMQSIKVQVESALVQVDRVLASNQINFAALSALPFFGAVWLVISLTRGAARWMRTSEAEAAVNRREMQAYMRMLLVEAERSIVKCEDRSMATAEPQCNVPKEVGMQVRGFCDSPGGRGCVFVSKEHQRRDRGGRSASMPCDLVCRLQHRGGENSAAR